MQELRGKLVYDQIKNECLDFVGSHNGIMPALAIVRVGERAEDIAYENSVKKRFMDFGLEVKTYELPANVSNADFQHAFRFINQDPEIHGILVMRPLPKQIDEEEMLGNMDPVKDLDGITRQNLAGVMMGEKDAFAPCTAQAVLEMLKGYQIEMHGKHAVIIGRSLVVGKPLAMLLLQENATVTVCHSKTENLKEICQSADILVVAVGRPQMVGSSYIREGATVIDVGINVDQDGHLVGDCNYDTISLKAGAVTPVPGGVGVVTTAVLAKHLVQAAGRQIKFASEEETKDQYLEDAWKPGRP
jgi:methylenetetrahydrofolate dehydrogenase (NADP+)/methenyltetrahydrofolate cyclohydrolase